MSFKGLIELIVIQFLPTVGFVLALLFLAHLLRSKRSPAATFAWLLAIVFVPYLGVPAYLFFGGRKMKKMTRLKKDLIEEGSSHHVAMHDRAHRESLHDADEIFPIRNNNSLKLLPKGTDAFNALMELIDSATKSIYITTYVFEKESTGEKILKALQKKAAQGVEVCLLIDAVGSRGLGRKDFKEFCQSGAKVSFFMPMVRLLFRGRANLRNHRKMVIVDRRHALVGGRNLADEYMGPEESLRRWKDLSVSIEGPAIGDLFAVFYSDWKFASGEQLDPWTPQEMGSPKEPSEIQVMPSGPDVSGDYLQEAIVEAIFAAKERFWIVTPYFAPSEMLMRSLSMASRRGVDVRIYVPAASNHRLADFVSRTYLRELEKVGVSIFQYKPTMLHAKLVVADQDLVITGSANMDMRSLFLNYEIAFLIHSDKDTIPFIQWVKRLEADCQPGRYKVSMARDVIEGMGRLLAPLI